MPGFLKHAASLFILFFLIGLWWGAEPVQQKLSNKLPPLKSSPVRILVLEDYLRQIDIADIEEKTGLRFIFKTAKTPKELFDEAHNLRREFDLIQTHSFHIDTLVNSKVLIPFPPDLRQIKQSLLSPDFTELPRGFSAYLFPTHWQFIGFLIPKTWAMSDSDQLSEEHRTYLMTDPFPSYLFAKARGWVFDSWIESDQDSRIVRRLQQNINVSLYRSESLEHIHGSAAFQAIHGYRDYPSKKDEFQFVYSSTFNPMYIVGWGLVDKPAPRLEAVKRVINYFASKQQVQKMVAAGHPTPYQFAEELQIPADRKPSHIRSLPIPSLKVVTKHSAYQPLWQKSLKDSFEVADLERSASTTAQKPTNK